MGTLIFLAIFSFEAECQKEKDKTIWSVTNEICYIEAQDSTVLVKRPYFILTKETK